MKAQEPNNPNCECNKCCSDPGYDEMSEHDHIHKDGVGCGFFMVSVISIVFFTVVMLIVKYS